MIEVVSATRLSKREFWEKSPLGMSLKRLAHDDRLNPCIAYENRLGLPDVFNSRITARENLEILVFCHDDIWIDDDFFADRVIEGCNTYDVIGVAGNRRRIQYQPAWYIKTIVKRDFVRDDQVNLSGSIAHGTYPFGKLIHFGDAPAECELLDGVLLAAKKSTLTGKGVFFDPSFDFHFYDMDFCRTARAKQLRLGTWPIRLIHQSTGKFGSKPWRDKFRLYCEKWEF